MKHEKLIKCSWKSNPEYTRLFDMKMYDNGQCILIESQDEDLGMVSVPENGECCNSWKY